MTPTASHIVVLTSVMNVTDKNAHQATPIISAHVSRIIGYINGFVLTTLVGVLGVFTNTANICVYVKMGLSETTNISFFAMSISDLLVSLSAAVAQLTYNPPVSEMKLPSGAPLSEIGMAACFIMFPGMGCSAWITAILSLERCLCISTPLRVRIESFFLIINFDHSPISNKNIFSLYNSLLDPKECLGGLLVIWILLQMLIIAKNGVS